VLFRRRFADVIKSQLEVFEQDDADYLRRVSEAYEAYDRSDRGDSEELYGDYMELVESGTEALAEMRDAYAQTVDEGDADEYVREFNKAVLKRWPNFALEIEDV
jgi:bisphosphoglycerate-independent phosphoglycerate mutase (AlkP superfamily)